jgi:transcriptional regulator of acetoin/glycerol metabolism
LLAALAANHWQPRAAARQLGISRPSLYFLLDAFPRTRKAMDLSVEEIAEAGERCGGRLREMAAMLQVSEAGIRRRMKQLGLLPVPQVPPKPP